MILQSYCLQLNVKENNNLQNHIKPLLNQLELVSNKIDTVDPSGTLYIIKQSIEDIKNRQDEFNAFISRISDISSELNSSFQEVSSKIDAFSLKTIDQSIEDIKNRQDEFNTSISRISDTLNIEIEKLKELLSSSSSKSQADEIEGILSEINQKLLDLDTFKSGLNTSLDSINRTVNLSSQNLSEQLLKVNQETNSNISSELNSSFKEVGLKIDLFSLNQKDLNRLIETLIQNESSASSNLYDQISNINKSIQNVSFDDIISEMHVIRNKINQDQKLLDVSINNLSHDISTQSSYIIGDIKKRNEDTHSLIKEQLINSQENISQKIDQSQREHRDKVINVIRSDLLLIKENQEVESNKQNKGLELLQEIHDNTKPPEPKKSLISIRRRNDKNGKECLYLVINSDKIKKFLGR